MCWDLIGPLDPDGLLEGESWCLHHWKAGWQAQSLWRWEVLVELKHGLVEVVRSRF